MQIKKILALFLALVLCLGMLAACSKTSNETTGDPDDQQPNNQQDTQNQESEEPQEITEINVQFLNSNLSEDTDKIVEALNKITEEKIGVHVNLDYIEWGNYATVLSTAMAGGEPLDLVLTGSIAPFSFTAMYTNGQAMPITEYLNTYGQGILDTIPETYLHPFTYNGEIYGLPAYRLYASNAYVMMRKDVLDELGIYEQAMAMDSWSDYEAVLEAVKTNYTDGGMYALCGDKNCLAFNYMVIFGTDNFADATAFDCLGDTSAMIFTDENGHVSSLQATEKQKADYQMFARWLEAGYISPDTSVQAGIRDELVKNGAAFSMLTSSEFGWESTKTSVWETEACGVEISKIPVSTSTVTKFGVVVPVTAEEPEAAIKFLNLAYTDPDVVNLLDWGIQGEDYVVDENGVAQYPEGGATGYHNVDFSFGNQFLALPFGDQTSDHRAVCMTELENAKVSPYLGIAVDTTNLTNELAAITAVNDEFLYALQCGYYTDELYENYLEKLEDAGLQKYIDAYQTQLDAWLAQQ